MIPFAPQHDHSDRHGCITRRPGTRCLARTWFAVVLTLTPLPCSCDDLPHTTYARATFARATLLSQFDVDKNGRLAPVEKIALRKAFGNVDVPMLPDLPTTPPEPTAGHLRELLTACDNSPADNPLTDAGITLGRVLFYDTNLSRNNSIACASCHLQQHGFSDPRTFSAGFAGGTTRRNAMGLVNLRFTHDHGARPGFFWDERAATLEDQVLMPIQDAVEMGMDLHDLERKLQRLPYYPPLFEAAFGHREVTRQGIARAVAQFLRTLVSLNSKFDRAAGDVPPGNYSTPFPDFTDQENLGKSLFIDGVGQVAEFGCAFCHRPPTFGMPKSFNNGLELTYQDPGLGALAKPANDPFTPSNDGKFKAPSLRNIAQSAPYMHDGRFRTLEEVVHHYGHGIRRHENLGLAFHEQDHESKTTGYRFTPDQEAALVAFLKTLTDEEFLTNPDFADPFVRRDAPPADPAAGDSAAQQYQQLVDEYEDGTEAPEVSRKLFQLADRFRDDPTAIDALVWIVTKLRSRPEAVQALEQLGLNHGNDEKMDTACAAIARVPSTAAEKLLRRLLEKNPHRHVQAEACRTLANLLEQQSTLVEQLREQPESRDRVLQYYGKEYGKHLQHLTREELDAQREKIYERMIDSFGNIAIHDTTLGDVGRKSLFALRHLSVGRAAPEIEGEDIHGKKFKLSDYRGKVVVLSFWGHW